MSPSRLDPTATRASGPDSLDIPALDVLGDRLERAATVSIERRAHQHERSRRAPWAWGLAVAPALAVLVAILLVGTQMAPAADAQVVKAADRTAGRTTGRFVMTTTVGAPSGPGTTVAAGTATSVQLQVEGVYDRASGRMRTTIDLGKLLGGPAGQGPAGQGPAGQGGSALAGIGGTVETIQDGSRLYLKADLFTRSLPGHPEWVSVDLSALGTPGASGPGTVADVLGSGAGGALAADPADLLDALRGIGTDTHVVEHVVLDGTSTTHYRGTVDLAAAARASGPAESARLRDGFARLGLDPTGAQLPMDVWVDDAGDVRRIQTTLDLSQARAADGTPVGAGPTVVTTDYRDLGRPDPVVLPGGDVVDITAMVRGALAGPIGSAGTAPAPR